MVVAFFQGFKPIFIQFLYASSRLSSRLSEVGGAPDRIAKFSNQITGGWGRNFGGNIFDSIPLLKHVHFEDFGPTCELDPKRRNFEGGILDSILLLENANFDNFGPRCEPEPKIPNFEENMLSPIPFFNGTSDRLANKLQLDKNRVVMSHQPYICIYMLSPDRV